MIKYRIGKCIVLVLLLLNCSNTKLFAQVNPDNFAEMVDFMPPPPNAASVIKNGMLSVNKNTGSPNVNIPLYSISGQKLSAAVSLNYSSTGIKVDEVAGRAGMGWALNAGGVITRTLRGSPDESNTRETIENIDYNCQTSVFLTLCEPYSPSSGHDAQPDLFNYNMNGLSGSFILDNSTPAKALELSPQKNKIEYFFTGTPAANFIITTTDGVKYYFGGTNATEYSKRLSTCGKTYDSYLANAWYLTKIEHPNGEKIDFTYTRFVYMHDNGTSETMTYGGIHCNSSSTPQCMNIVQTDGVRVSSISNDYTIIDLEYAERTDVSDVLISEVKIRDKNIPGTVRGKFVFGYDTKIVTTTYPSIASPQGNIKPARTPYLILLTEHSQASEFTRSHTFSYISPEDRPKRLSFAQDHWGYFNGKNNNTLIPTPDDPTTAGWFPNALADRSVSESYAQKGMLQNITYPTGGTETIEYEINKWYNTITSANDNVGGVRVKKISTQNPGETANEKNYYYGEMNNLSRSTLYAAPTPQYQKNSWGMYLFHSCSTCADSYAYCEQVSLYSNSLNSLNMYQNSPISYEYVVEGLGNSFSGGAVENRFFVAGDYGGITESGNYILGSPLTNGSTALNGKLREETILKKGSTTLFPIKKTAYEYESDSRLFASIKGWAINESKPKLPNIAYTVCNYPSPTVAHDGKDFFDVVRYHILSSWVYLKAQVETQWDENGANPVVKSTQFYHDNTDHLLTTRIESTDGEGRTTKTVLEYPTDFPSNPVCSAMVTKNILAPVIRYTQTKTSSNTPISQVVTSYGNPSSGNYLPSQIERSTQGAALANEGTFDSYDSKGNLLQYTDKSGVVNAIVWGYGSLYPVAKITGSTYAAAIAYLTSGSVTALQTMDGEALLTELNKIRTGLPNAYVTTYTYKHLAGVTTIIDPNNKRSTYLYDSFNRLILVRDQDGNIVKRICYNYQGQAENCTIPSCDYTLPIWQNTSTPLRCEIVSCAYTGNQQQEKTDVNPCSSTYNANQWVNVGYNPSACTAMLATITYGTSYSGYTIEYTSSTGIKYSFTIPASPPSGTLGCVPVGKYTIRIYRTSGTPINTTFMVGSNIVSGTEATFNNISLSVGNRDVYIGMVP